MIFKKDNNGYTMVELMMAVAIGAILMAAASATYVAQNRSYVAQEVVSEVNTQTKIAHDIIANDLRNAGFGWSEDLDLDESLINNVNYVVPIDNDITTDAVTIYGGLRYLGMLFPFGYSTNSADLDCSNPTRTTEFDKVHDDHPALQPNQISIDPPGDADEEENFLAGIVITVDGHFTAQVTACDMDMDGFCNPRRLTLNQDIPRFFPLWDTDVDADSFCDMGRPVYVFEDHTYCVDANETLQRIRVGGIASSCSPTGPSIVDELADNIEDFQLRYAVDANDDGIIDGPNNNGQFDNPEDFLDIPVAAAQPFIKAVRINILARSEREDTNYEGQGTPPDFIANRDWTGAPDDNFRRRWLRSMVRIRNR